MIRLAVDRTLGRRFVERLRAGGLDVTTMADIWGEGAAQRSDVDWIRWAGARRRVALTADESIHFLRAKRDAVVAVRLQIFCFPHTVLPVGEQARRVLSLHPAMERLAADRPGPWLATLYDDRTAITWPSHD
jgi:PIN like domain